MQSGSLLFVYGTLRKGESADLSKRLQVSFIGEDQINGDLYRLGWFPGVTLTPGQFDPSLPAVHGDVFRIKDASIIPMLDAYEGYPSLFDRMETETAGGRHVTVYTYARPILDPLSRMASGDWKLRDKNMVVMEG
jgi:gamma-glutamylcyclotransferase (GGCT)/AIG2-like uncharacterized protein YtfP